MTTMMIERNGEGGGYTVYRTRKGWRVSQWSRITGHPTCGQYAATLDAIDRWLDAHGGRRSLGYTAAEIEAAAEAMLRGDIRTRTIRRPFAVA